jgi:hypothetical protein
MSISPTSTLVDLPSADSKSLFFDNGGLDFDPSMSLSTINDFSLLASSFNLKQQQPQPALSAYSFPLLPSAGSTPDASFDFDLESFTHQSPPSDGSFDALGFAASTPDSTTLVSPKTSASVPFSVPPLDETINLASNDPLAAEALSNHHLQRYLHYKALANQAEAAACRQQEQFDYLLAYTMVGDDQQQPRQLASGYPMMDSNGSQYYGVPAQSFGQANYHVAAQQSTAAAMHAQAQAHMQAHDAAMARAQQQRVANSMPYYVPQRLSFEVQQPMQQAPHMWSRHSISSSVHSPPYPSTPNSNPGSLPLGMSNSSTSISMPALPVMAAEPARAASASEGEVEMDDELESSGGDDDEGSTSSLPVANAHGGGRGYVPGKTPDDPKKKHKCNICGRGFARAFNLKVSSSLLLPRKNPS